MYEKCNKNGFVAILQSVDYHKICQC